MNLVNDNGTIFIVGEKGKIGIADPAALTKFQAVTGEMTTGSTSAVPQVGVFKTGQAESVLVDE